MGSDLSHPDDVEREEYARHCYNHGIPPPEGVVNPDLYEEEEDGLHGVTTECARKDLITSAGSDLCDKRFSMNQL